MDLLATMFCLWAAVPGPPGFTLNGAWFQALPVRRNSPPCDNMDVERDVLFHLYKGSDITTYNQLIPGDNALLKLSGFDSKLPTVVYVHGFLNGLDAEEVEVMKQAYATRGGHNFIAVGWKRLSAGPWYFSAVANVTPVGKYLARLLDFLETETGPLTSLHLIGHSLGSHVVGVAASNTSVASVKRITALDPALPLIDMNNREARLDDADAPFVDVIHTDGGGYGMDLPLGHADFYPNGGQTGTKQPGCGLMDSPASLNFLGRVFCSHRRSYWLYAATVVRELAFTATKCDSWEKFQEGACADELQVPMGFATPTSARGRFYLKVQEVPPY